jgi:hypothetical protein
MVKTYSKRSLERHRRRWVDNITMGLTVVRIGAS